MSTGPVIVALLLVQATAGPSPGQDGASERLEAELKGPRDFGYLTGDLLELHASVRVPKGFGFAAARQPEAAWPAWLETRESAWEVREAADGRFYDFRFLFQIFYVADSLTYLEIPARRLVFRAERTAEELEAELPPFRFSLSPLTDANSTLEPDLIILPPSTRLVWFSGALLAALCLWLVVLRVGHRRHRRVFRRAQRDVRRARDCDEALLRLHRALEERAGKALFAHDLEPLTDRWPAAEDLRGELERFFGLSEAVFYGNGRSRSEDCLGWVQDLASRLVTLERQTGGRAPPKAGA